LERLYSSDSNKEEENKDLEEGVPKMTRTTTTMIGMRMKIPTFKVRMKTTTATMTITARDEFKDPRSP
jgi:hypothetical protein